MAADSRTRRFRKQILALLKLCQSFRKPDWEIADYPVSIRTQEPGPAAEGSRFRLKPYAASIVNWNLTGVGDSPEEALQNLRTTFAEVKQERRKTRKPLPRPGTQVPIKFASRERIDAHSELADDFIHRILDLEWAWISDESSLWDFSCDETNDALCAKIRDVYEWTFQILHLPSCQRSWSELNLGAAAG
jgi:hypothetical protein